MKDYREVESELRVIAGDFGSMNRSLTTPFKGRNFMTENVAVRRRHTSGIWFELSYGRGMGGSWLYGVTFADMDGNDYHEQSGCCSDTQEVREKLDAVLNKGKVVTA